MWHEQRRTARVIAARVDRSPDSLAVNIREVRELDDAALDALFVPPGPRPVPGMRWYTFAEGMALMDAWSILAYVFTALVIAFTISYTFFDLPGRLSGTHKRSSDDPRE